MSVPCFAPNFSVFSPWGLTLGHLVAKVPSLPKNRGLSYLLQRNNSRCFLGCSYNVEHILPHGILQQPRS